MFYENIPLTWEDGDFLYHAEDIEVHVDYQPGTDDTPPYFSTYVYEIHAVKFDKYENSEDVSLDSDYHMYDDLCDRISDKVWEQLNS